MGASRKGSTCANISPCECQSPTSRGANGACGAVRCHVQAELGNTTNCVSLGEQQPAEPLDLEQSRTETLCDSYTKNVINLTGLPISSLWLEPLPTPRPLRHQPLSSCHHCFHSTQLWPSHPERTWSRTLSKVALGRTWKGACSRFNSKEHLLMAGMALMLAHGFLWTSQFLQELIFSHHFKNSQAWSFLQMKSFRFIYLFSVMLWKQSAPESLYQTLSGNSFPSGGQNFSFLSLILDFER